MDILAGDAAERLLARMLDVAHDAGLLKARGCQRTDSTHVLAAVRALNRLELLAETLRAALNAIAVVAPDWLRTLAPPEWHERYDRRVEGPRPPKTEPPRPPYLAQAPMWARSEQMAFFCLMQSTGARHRRRPPCCPRLPCCAGCGRGTSSGMRQDQTPVRSAGTRYDSGRRRAVAPGTASSPLTTARLAFGPRPAPAGPAIWFTWPRPAMPGRRAWWCTPTPHRPTSTRRCAPRSSTTPWPPRGWPRPSTWWTPATSAPSTSSGRASGMALT